MENNDIEETMDAAALFGDNIQIAPAPKTKKTSSKSRKVVVEAKTPAQGMPKRVKILLEENDDIPPTGLPLGHNGTSYVIVPGEPVEVPEFLLDILDSAVMSGPQVDPQTRRVIGYRDRLRFPYRRL